MTPPKKKSPMAIASPLPSSVDRWIRGHEEPTKTFMGVAIAIDPFQGASYQGFQGFFASLKLTTISKGNESYSTHPFSGVNSLLVFRGVY